jgi:hypothetical protein
VSFSFYFFCFLFFFPHIIAATTVGKEEKKQIRKSKRKKNPVEKMCSFISSMMAYALGTATIVEISEVCNHSNSIQSSCSHIVFLKNKTNSSETAEPFVLVMKGPLIWRKLKEMPRNSEVYRKWRDHFQRYEFYPERKQKKRSRSCC